MQIEFSRSFSEKSSCFCRSYDIQAVSKTLYASTQHAFLSSRVFDPSSSLMLISNIKIMQN